MITSIGDTARLTRNVSVEKQTELNLLAERSEKYRILKRIFDVVFSLLMMVFILCWLFPPSRIINQVRLTRSSFFTKKGRVFRQNFQLFQVQNDGCKRGSQHEDGYQ
jgi:lipopolysaccharide/colanic/teichoic acid biosynthesis glycosyltransferase